MTIYTDAASLLGRHVDAVGGESLGRIDHVYTEPSTGAAEWVAVHTGFFGNHISLVPVSAFSWTAVGRTLTVSLSEEAVSRAPHHDPGALISTPDEQALNSYYQIALDPEAESARTVHFDHTRLHRTGVERSDIPR